MSRNEARERAGELLTMVGIPNAKDRLGDYPHQFSGGMRQRAMIAMALTCSPQMLIADEPTTALDVTIQAQIVELVKRLRDELGMAIIWITHDLGIIAGLAERVIVMYAGYIVEEAPVKELYGNPQHPYTLGLLGSLPRLDASTHTRLVSIDGMPPVLMQKPTSCPFAPRCHFVVERCLQENPPLLAVGHGPPGGLLGGYQDRGGCAHERPTTSCSGSRTWSSTSRSLRGHHRPEAGRRGARGGRRFVRHPPRRNARPGGRVRLRQVDHRPHDPAALPAHRGARVLRGHRPGDAQGRGAAPDAAPRCR